MNRLKQKRSYSFRNGKTLSGFLYGGGRFIDAKYISQMVAPLFSEFSVREQEHTLTIEEVPLASANASRYVFTVVNCTLKKTIEFEARAYLLI